MAAPERPPLSSSQALYPSLPHECESSLIPLLLLSPTKPKALSGSQQGLSAKLTGGEKTRQKTRTVSRIANFSLPPSRLRRATSSRPKNRRKRRLASKRACGRSLLRGRLCSTADACVSQPLSDFFDSLKNSSEIYDFRGVFALMRLRDCFTAGRFDFNPAGLSLPSKQSGLFRALSQKSGDLSF